MAFNYIYKSDEELDLSYKHLAPGECKFIVKSVATKDDRGFELTTSAGHPMMKLEYVAIDCKGERGLVNDIISANAAWKLKELVTSLGVPHLYGPQASFEPEMLIGLQGCAILADREFTKRDGTVAVTTSVKNYLAGEVLPKEKIQELEQAVAVKSEVPDDGIPF